MRYTVAYHALCMESILVTLCRYVPCYSLDDSRRGWDQSKGDISLGISHDLAQCRTLDSTSMSLGHGRVFWSSEHTNYSIMATSLMEGQNS